MRVVVTGAGGMLGQAVLRIAAQLDYEVIAYQHAQLDITDEQAVVAAFAAKKPDAVLNCAAWTDVDLAQSQLLQAYRVNAEGAGNVAFAAAQLGVPVVQVSTDYVFSGVKQTPWLESDALLPINAYGATKLAGELAVAAKNPSHAIARTAWLFGSGGKNFVETMLTLGAERSLVQVVDDQVGCPTWVDDLAQALLALAENLIDSQQAQTATGIYHLAARGQCSWFEFAKEIFRQAKIDCHVEPVTSEYFKRPASRPAYSVLQSERDTAPLLATWQEGLAGYLGSRL